ncbi:putative transducer of erbb2 (tob) [Schistosoma mansoni]|uniref:Putative transducer of erbb2 (Tob) n=1 Tax=Schistosoma mansoni TaxID=6183 RepID=G4VSU0_SCHMA|nr:putative transducer of erbb2 (tob) [Schistosoma mansoni]|eukprot:XP_018655520.1 putative transducer of erbb2 (tob) [Schistosoma mansoni]
MFMEITVAVNYILSHLYTKLPRRRVDSFGEELEKYLLAKFQHHWYPSDPFRDSAYRCINSVGPQVDLLLLEAAAVSGLEWGEIEACLPEGLIISVDPGHVVCQYNQSNCTGHDRFLSNHWPSSSISLSSSGCSSASSISSSNLTNSSQITHQVLYSLQDGWITNNTNMLDVGKRGQFLTKLRRFENDHGDLLSTAAALSVLVEPDEGIDTKFEPNTTYGVSSLALNRANWNNESSVISTSIINQEEPSRTESNEVDLKSINPLQAVTYHEKEMLKTMNTFPWGFSENAKESFLSITGNDSTGGTLSTTQSVIFNAKAHTFHSFHRSSSNPPQSGQLTTTHGKEFIALSANFENSNVLCSKSDQPFNQMFTNPLPKSYPTYIQPLNSSHPFVQKSTSTPSFTAATFAQTKFGSTKLKSHPKRTPTRILSPTTVQQTITANENFLLNDRVLTNLLTNNQGFDASNSSNMSAFRRFLPMNTDINTTKQTGYIPMNESNIPNHNDYLNINLHENGNSVSEMKFLPISFHQRDTYNHSNNNHNNNNDTFLISNLENYLLNSSEDTSPNSILERIHLNEVHNDGHTASSYWQSSFEKHLQSTNMTMATTDEIDLKSDNTDFTNLADCTNWNNDYHSSANRTTFNHVSNNLLLDNNFKSNLTRLSSTCVSSPAEQHQIQQQQVNMKTNENLTGSIEAPTSNNISNINNDCLLDDVLLSTRMVNLLLEEDNLTDSINRENMFNYLHSDDDEIEGFKNIKSHFTLTNKESDQNDKDIHTDNSISCNNGHLAFKEVEPITKYNESNLIHTGTSIAGSVTDNMPSMVAT